MITLDPNELIVDSFAGGGGASQGIFMATGRHPDVAINHDPEAVAMHARNHPDTLHFCKSIYQVDPDDIIRKFKRPVGLAWFSPDCTHHSKARGDKPKEKHIRDLAWVVVHFAERAIYQGKRPRVLIIENVEEFKDWGPLLEDGKACKLQKGFEFQRWVKALRKLGYKVEWRELRACDYGAPTIRKRLFIVARCDGLPIAWPVPTHGKGLIPYRTAAECIDWSIPCPSIFERKKPLAENTLRRIAKGIKRYVIDAAEPFIVRVNHGDSGGRRAFGLDEPLTTVTQSQGEALVTPKLSPVKYHCNVCQESFADEYATDIGGLAPAECPICGEEENISSAPFIVNMSHGGKIETMDKPISTIATEKGGCRAITVPILVGAGGPARAGEPKDANAPLGTLMARNHTQLVTAFLAQHNGQRNGVNPGRAADKPISTITSEGSQQGVVAATIIHQTTGNAPSTPDAPLKTIATGGHHSLATSHLLKLKGTCKDGQPVTEPMPTVQAQGLHTGEVRALLLKYYGNERDGVALTEPMHTVTAKERFGLVMVHGEPYIIVDIGMRMLAPRELYRAQGFPVSYVIDFTYGGKPLTKTAQVRMCGNSVSPPPAAALVAAQFGIRLEMAA